ncbi:hypothetical protein ES708_31984 [subsurface metagenome]
MAEENKYEPIKKVSIVISKGSLDGVYTGNVSIRYHDDE